MLHELQYNIDAEVNYFESSKADLKNQKAMTHLINRYTKSLYNEKIFRRYSEELALHHSGLNRANLTQNNLPYGPLLGLQPHLRDVVLNHLWWGFQGCENILKRLMQCFWNSRIESPYTDGSRAVEYDNLCEPLGRWIDDFLQQPISDIPNRWLLAAIGEDMIIHVSSVAQITNILRLLQKLPLRTRSAGSLRIISAAYDPSRRHELPSKQIFREQMSDKEQNFDEISNKAVYGNCKKKNSPKIENVDKEYQDSSENGRNKSEPYIPKQLISYREPKDEAHEEGGYDEVFFVHEQHALNAYAWKTYHRRLVQIQAGGYSDYYYRIGWMYGAGLFDDLQIEDIERTLPEVRFDQRLGRPSSQSPYETVLLIVWLKWYHDFKLESFRSLSDELMNDMVSAGMPDLREYELVNFPTNSI